MWFDDSSFIYSYDLYYYDDTYNGRMLYYGPYEIFPSPVYPDTCFGMMGADFTSYIEGCGDYTHYYNDYHYCMPCQQLDYFKKGEDEWGTPYEIPVGIEEPDRTDIFIYPNPVNDRITIESLNQDYRDIVVNIFSNDGRLISSEKYSVIPELKYLDISFLKPGIYFLKIDSESFSASKKIIKM